MSDGQAKCREKLVLGHPPGLFTLFFTELWERFSYYGMRGFLVLFLVDSVSGGYGMSEATAAAIYGLYTSFVYIAALPGGWFADRLIGQRNAVFTGGVIIACGHFSLAVPTTVTFYLGLVLIILGTGLLKPNVSAMVGGLYPEGGARRDAGFSIFYMGINVGALLGPLVCGFLGEKINWHLGFGAAGIGMLLGLASYKWGSRYFGDVGLLRPEEAGERAAARRRFSKGILIVLGLVAILSAVRIVGLLRFTLPGFALGLSWFVGALAVSYFTYLLLFSTLDTGEKKRVLVIFFLVIGAALFWSGFEQAGSSMNLFAMDWTNRVVFGFEAPASWLQSVNPIFIIALAPVFGMLWVRLASREPSIPAKFGYGLGLLGIGHLVLAWGATYVGDGGPGVSPMWLIVTYFLHTAGELCLSPVGLSSVTKLAPKRLVGQAMGTWFMGSAMGNLIAGLIAGRLETMTPPRLFLTVAAFTIGSGCLFLFFSRPIRKLVGTGRMPT